MQAFNGIRVIDFTHVLAGPFCTYQLAVMGAEVIKVEAPDALDMMRAEGASRSLGNDLRGTHFLAQSGNKKSVLIDIRSSAGRKVVERLVQESDVVVENFRCGVMEKLGLDYASLKTINPKLVYCSMTGFGQTGPKAQHPAYDNVIQAFSGMMAQTGDIDNAPVRVGPPVLDYGTGAQAAFAIAAALLQRTRTDVGQHIDVSMLDAALMLMSTSVLDTQITGAAPVPPGNSSLTHPGYGCFETSSGLVMIGAFTVVQHAALWRVLGREDIAATIATLDSHSLSQRLNNDRALLSELLLQHGAQHWEDTLNDAGVPAARVRNLNETLAEPQVASRSVLQQSKGFCDEDATLKSPVAAFDYAHGGPSVDRQAPPSGFHTDEVLISIGYSQKELDTLRETQVIG